MLLDLIHAGVYRQVEKLCQTTTGTFISLTVSGMEYQRIFYPSGKCFLDCPQGPFLYITPPGFKVDFSFGADRENYVLQCNVPGLFYDENEPFLKLAYGSETLNLRKEILLEDSALPRFRETFEKILALSSSPVPCNVFMAEQLCGGLIAEFAVNDENKEKKYPAGDIAGRLKHALDEDCCFLRTLSEHCYTLGCSVGHARRCFQERYNITPGEYRMRKKFELLKLLLGSSQLSQKEIAAAAGMKNVTHLHSFIRQRTGMSVSELVKTLPR